MALIRVKYIDPDNEELFGVDQDVPQNLVKRTGKTTDDGLQEGVLHWPKEGGSGKGKKMKSKSPKKYRVALLDSPPPASKALLTGHGRGRYDKPDFSTKRSEPAPKRQKISEIKTLSVVTPDSPLRPSPNPPNPSPLQDEQPGPSHAHSLQPQDTTQEPDPSPLFTQSVTNWLETNMESNNNVEWMLQQMQCSLEHSLDCGTRDIKAELESKCGQLEQKVFAKYDQLEQKVLAKYDQLDQKLSKLETAVTSALHQVPSFQSPCPPSRSSMQSMQSHMQQMSPASPAYSDTSFLFQSPHHQPQLGPYPLLPPAHEQGVPIPPTHPPNPNAAQQGSSCLPDIYLSKVLGLGNPPPSPTKSNIENVCSVLRECRVLIKKGKYTLVAIRLARKVIYGTEMMNKVNKIDQLPLHLTDFLKSVMRHIIPEANFDTKWEEILKSITRSCKTYRDKALKME